MQDYKEPERVPPAAAMAQQLAAAPSAAGAQPEPMEEEPKFTAFVGAGRKLNGKPATSIPIPQQAAASSSAAAAAAASSSSPAAGSSAKAGTFVSFGNEGNRLMAKLNKDKAPAPAPPPAEEPEDEEPKFKAFQGTGRSLRG